MPRLSWVSVGRTLTLLVLSQGGSFVRQDRLMNRVGDAWMGANAPRIWTNYFKIMKFFDIKIMSTNLSLSTNHFIFKEKTTTFSNDFKLALSTFKKSGYGGAILRSICNINVYGVFLRRNKKHPKICDAPVICNHYSPRPLHRERYGQCKHTPLAGQIISKSCSF